MEHIFIFKVLADNAWKALQIYSLLVAGGLIMSLMLLLAFCLLWIFFQRSLREDEAVIIMPALPMRHIVRWQAQRAG